MYILLIALCPDYAYSHNELLCLPVQKCLSTFLTAPLDEVPTQLLVIKLIFPLYSLLTQVSKTVVKWERTSEEIFLVIFLFSYKIIPFGDDSVTRLWL